MANVRGRGIDTECSASLAHVLLLTAIVEQNVDRLGEHLVNGDLPHDRVRGVIPSEMLQNWVQNIVYIK